MIKPSTRIIFQNGNVMKNEKLKNEERKIQTLKIKQHVDQ